MSLVLTPGNVFQSTPPPERGATRLWLWTFSALDCFNPRPPPERGATLCEIALRSKQEVSIHAPLRREERHFLVRKDIRLDRVSIHAPLRRERSDHGGSDARVWRRFQSTPPPERGATFGSAPSCVMQSQSFNPRPPPERGATPDLADCSCAQSVFQSTPPPERGATSLVPSAHRRESVSIHAPLRREERLAASSHGPANASSFNPRPPPERGATLVLGQQRSFVGRFQSTPPSEESSDIALDPG